MRRRMPFLESLIRSEPVRMGQIAAGILLILLAPIVGLPLPGPAGFVMFGFGLALIFRNSRWARRRYLLHTRHYPRVRRAVDFGLRRKKGRRALERARQHAAQRAEAGGAEQPAPIN
jgi:hypothetical protein